MRLVTAKWPTIKELSVLAELCDPPETSDADDKQLVMVSTQVDHLGIPVAMTADELDALIDGLRELADRAHAVDLARAMEHGHA